MLTIKDKINKISVPYRGATFLNFDLNYFQFCCQYFRPLSGSYISQFLCGDKICIIGKYFRPLSGSYISQYVPSLFIFVKCSTDFRPLSGSYISQFDDVRGVRLYGFPSPIGELHFSIPSPQPHVLSGTNRGIAGEK